jgi:hypothetical protein
LRWRWFSDKNNTRLSAAKLEAFVRFTHPETVNSIPVNSMGVARFQLTSWM